MEKENLIKNCWPPKW